MQHESCLYSKGGEKQELAQKGSVTQSFQALEFCCLSPVSTSRAEGRVKLNQSCASDCHISTKSTRLLEVVVILHDVSPGFVSKGIPWMEGERELKLYTFITYS